MRILIAEDERITRQSLLRQLQRWGHDVVAAEDGAQAWERFQNQQFDIVVTDWDMPHVDGRELIERIRGSESSNYVYLIMLTGRSETTDLVAGMESGADDFLAKPFDRSELRVRLRAGERIIQLERSLAARNEELEKANDRMRRDLEAAAQIQQSLLPTESPAVEACRFAWRYEPCDELAGDSLNVFAIDDRFVCMYVLDVVGHGVPAALLSVAVTRSLSLGSDRSSLVTQPSERPPGYTITGPAEVARRLNVIYPMDASSISGQYFTIIYGVLDTQTGRFRFTAAGHPGPLLVRRGEIVAVPAEPAFPIGMFAEAEYKETVVDLGPHDRLYMHSDGVNEEMNAAGEQLGTARLGTMLVEGSHTALERSIEHVIQEVVSWRGDKHFADDVSILGVEMQEV